MVSKWRFQISLGCTLTSALCSGFYVWSDPTSSFPRRCSGFYVWSDPTSSFPRLDDAIHITAWGSPRWKLNVLEGFALTMSASASNSDSEDTTIGYGPKRPLYGRRSQSNRSSHSSASSRSSDLPILRRRDTDEQTWRRLRHKAAMDALQAAIASDEPELTPHSRSEQSCSSDSSALMTPMNALSGASPDHSNNGGGRPLQLSGSDATLVSQESQKSSNLTGGDRPPAHGRQSVSARQTWLHSHSDQNSRSSKSRKRTLAATIGKREKHHPATARARSKFGHLRDQQTLPAEESCTLAPVRRIKLSQIISSFTGGGVDGQSTNKQSTTSSASDEESIGDIEESDDEDESIGEAFDSNDRAHDLRFQAQEWINHADNTAEVQSEVVQDSPQPSVKEALTAPSSWLAKASQELVASDTGTPTAIGSPGAKLKPHSRKVRLRTSSSRHAFSSQLDGNDSDSEDVVVPPQGFASRFIRLQRAHASELARFTHFRSKLANSQKRVSQGSEMSQSLASQGPNVISNFRWTDENPAAVKLRVRFNANCMWLRALFSLDVAHSINVHRSNSVYACRLWQVARLRVVGAHRLACCEVVQHPTAPRQIKESGSCGVLARNIVKSELPATPGASVPVIVDVFFSAQTTKRLRLDVGVYVRIFPPWISVRVWQGFTSCS